MKIAAIVLLACPVFAQDRPGTGWKNVTGGVGGETWGYAGVTLVAAVPDRDEVLAGVSESGLWSSVDGGETWKKLGAQDREPIKHRPHQIVFDPKRVSYGELLRFFFANHDATTPNRQGPDVGDQYRSAVFAADTAQLESARAFVAELAGTPRYAKRKIVTQLVAPGPRFWPAEDYHQDYHLKHGGSCQVKSE